MAKVLRSSLPGGCNVTLRKSEISEVPYLDITAQIRRVDEVCL
jgi:hypothetical protein